MRYVNENNMFIENGPNIRCIRILPNSKNPTTLDTQILSVETDDLVDVLLPLPLSQVYTYRVQPNQKVFLGSLVRVPWGKGQKILTGMVWAKNIKAPVSAIKPIFSCLEELPPLSPEIKSLIDWIAEYNMVPAGNVLKMVMGLWQQVKKISLPTKIQFTGKMHEDSVFSADIQKIAELTQQQIIITVTELMSKSRLSRAKITKLFQQGFLHHAPLNIPSIPAVPLHPMFEHFNEEQRQAAHYLSAQVTAQKFQPVLLYGVTGSGKTEVYFQAIMDCVRLGKQALVLLPEIALSTQWLERFHERFGYTPPAWHSEIPLGQKRRIWYEISTGVCSVIVGARSALFLPFQQLGLIVVDEEHDSSFKQEEGSIYHARDIAVVRAQIAACPVVLSSATPSLETLANVKRGRYHECRLTARHSQIQMPRIQIIDLIALPPTRQHWLAKSLCDQIDVTLSKGQQTLLFLNRRGYAPLVLCKACGFRWRCEHCSSWLVQHRQKKMNLCHYCGYHTPLTDTCPNCHEHGSMVTCGPGVEKLAEEVATLFPSARTIVSTSDTLGDQQQIEKFVRQVEAQEVDIIIGTQVIAKGHHFPHLTLVGIIDADAGLQGGDLRAGEKTWQMLQQVSGRAGRSNHPGQVMIQTYQPMNPLIQALATYDQESFLAIEGKNREIAGMPPFGRLAALIVSAPSEPLLHQICAGMQAQIPRGEGFVILGPAPAPLSMIRGRYRQRFLLKTTRHLKPQLLIQKWLKNVVVPAPGKIIIDIDPYNFL